MNLDYVTLDIQLSFCYLAPTNGGRFPLSETALRKIANRPSWVDRRCEWKTLSRNID